MTHRNSKRKKKKPPQAGLLKGRLEITRSGMGFVIVEKQEQDVLVRPNDFNTALNGDNRSCAHYKGFGKKWRQQGEVAEVVERKQMEFVGHVEISPSFAFFIADTEKPMPDIYIPLAKLNGAPGSSAGNREDHRMGAIKKTAGRNYPGAGQS